MLAAPHRQPPQGAGRGQPRDQADRLAERWTRLARYLEADGSSPEASRADRPGDRDRPRSVPAWTMAARIRGVGGQPRRRRRRLPPAGRDRPPQPHRVPDRRRQARGPAGPRRRRRSRPAATCSPRRRATPSTTSSSPSSASSSARTRRGSTPSAGPSGSTRTTPKVDPHAGRDPRRPVPHRGGHRALLAGLREGRGPRRQARHGHPAHRALPPAQPVRPPARAAPARSEARPSSRPQQRESRSAWPRPTPPRATWARPAPSSSACWRPTPATSSSSSSSPSSPRRRATSTSAAKYQKQLNELAPSDEGSTRLAQLYVRLGEIDEAAGGLVEAWPRARASPTACSRRSTACSANDKPRAVLEITEGMLRKDPRDWEALYREGVALMALDRPDDAVRQFRALLDLRTADDEKSAIVKARTRDPKLNASAARPSRYQRTAPMPLEERIGQATQIRMATKLETRYSYSRSQAYVWSPGDFGQARMAALGWMLVAGDEDGQGGRAPRELPGRRGTRRRATRRRSGTGSTSALSATTTRQAYEAAREPQPGRPDRPAGALGVPERAGRAPARPRPAVLRRDAARSRPTTRRPCPPRSSSTSWPATAPCGSSARSSPARRSSGTSRPS